MASFQDNGKIGDLCHSMLTESQIQTYYGDGWILCDGRSVSGSLYHTITGNSSVPNAMGRYLRAKDNGAGVDPNADSALGTLRADQNKAHGHPHTATHTHLRNYGVADGSSDSPRGLVGIASIVGTEASSATAPASTDSDGGADVQPLSVVVNVFIKIN